MRFSQGDLCLASLAADLDSLLLQSESPPPAILVDLLRTFEFGPPPGQHAPRCSVVERPCDPGRARQAAMPPRLRVYQPASAPPTLAFPCRLCEASYPSQDGIDEHIKWVHGGMARYREAWLFLESCQPHATSPQEQRAAIQNFSFCYRYGARSRSQPHLVAVLPTRDPHASLWLAVYRSLAGEEVARVPSFTPSLGDGTNGRSRRWGR